jgi:hypothetical protein
MSHRIIIAPMIALKMVIEKDFVPFRQLVKRKKRAATRPEFDPGLALERETKFINQTVKRAGQ